MIFEDPIRTIRVELPAGWSYDSFASSLTDFVFARWDQPEVLVIIHVRPSKIAGSRPDEEWIEQIRTEASKAISLDDMVSNHGRAVVAAFESKGVLLQRVAFVRGPNVELAIEQRGSERGVKNSWAPLEKAVLTASSYANGELPELGGRVEFNQSIEKANLAFEKKDFTAVADALGEAVRIGVYTWLGSLSSPDKFPEIHAAVRAAQTMAQLGRFTGSPFFLRDAEFVLRRAQRSLQDAGPIEESQDLRTEISEILESIISDVLGKADSGEEEQISPIVAARERGFRFSQAAAAAFDAKDYDNAFILAGAAIDCLLSLIAFFRHSRLQDIPEEIVAQLASQGITDLEGQRDAIQKARETVLLPPLNTALQIQYCCALEQKNSNGAMESAAVMIPVAQLACDANEGDTAGPALNLALALLNSALSFAMLQDKEQLELATHCLVNANQVLDAVGSKSCTSDTWIRYHTHQIDRSQHVMVDTMAAVGKSNDSVLEAQLKGIHSEFEKVASRLQEAIARCSNPG